MKNKMNSRERILAAINHKEPDRVPIDIGATLQTGIHAIAYTKLKEHLGMKGGHTRIHDVGQQLAEIEPIVFTMRKPRDPHSIAFSVCIDVFHLNNLECMLQKLPTTFYKRLDDSIRTNTKQACRIVAATQDGEIGQHMDRISKPWPVSSRVCHNTVTEHINGNKATHVTLR